MTAPQTPSGALDPGQPAYERARIAMATELRTIGEQEPRSGFSEMADDLLQGDLMQVPTWVALQMLAALDVRATPGEGWQDIATAPRDGTPFLAGRAGGDIGSITVARKMPNWTGFHSIPGDWKSKATHWRPLPAPPTPDADHAGGEKSHG